MKRLVIVYSPRSARFGEVEEKVLEKARKLSGWMVCKFKVEEAPVRENAKRLAMIIRKGDLVLSAGGDGTATMVLNAIIESGKLATMAVMPFGNFNDYAESLGKMSLERIVRKFEEGQFKEFYPLEVKVNEKHYGHVGMYFSVGLMAESAGVLKGVKVRKKLKKAWNRMLFSARKTFFWLLRNKHRRDFLPEELTINGKSVVKTTTDYVAMNGNSMIGMIPGGVWYLASKEFWSGTMRNRSVLRMFCKFVKAMEGELPGGLTKKDVLEFPRPCDVYVHAEGEGERLRGVSSIEIQKTGKSLRVISA